jgi:SnoaL-like domain
MTAGYSDQEILDLVLEVAREEEPPCHTVEEAVRRLESREAIRNVMRAYCFYEDQHRWDEVVTLFTESCERIMAGTLQQTLKGRDELRAASGAPLQRTDERWGEGASRETLAATSFRHLLVTEMIKIKPDNRVARLVGYCQVVATRGAAAEYERGAHEATYYIEFTRPSDDHSWLIDKLVIMTEHASNPLFKQAPVT